MGNSNVNERELDYGSKKASLHGCTKGNSNVGEGEGFVL